MSAIKPIVSIFWFRRDLRLDDNAGLFRALQSECPVLPVFIFDTEILSYLHDRYDRRVDFIYRTLLNLQNELEIHDSSVCIKTGKPLDVFKQLVLEYNVKAVYTNRDYEPYALKRDNEVKAYLESLSVEFLTFKDQVVFEWNEVLKSDKSPYTVFTPYSRMWKQKLSEKDYHSYPSELLKHNFFKTGKIDFPTLEDIGFRKTDISCIHPVVNENIILHYDKTRDIPSNDGTTRLGVHLRFGTISIRKLVALAEKLNEAWLNELIWREFFMSILMHFPYVADGAFKKKYNGLNWRNNEDEFDRWCQGQTGYPIVDAGMRQLNETGWMHNRLRMIVASFLTKHLLIDWRWGEAYFASKLIDYELSSNNGNWQWVAGCGCDAVPYFRIFNPAEQVRKFDPERLYIRKWVGDPESTSYQQPIVDHVFARQRALETYKQIL